MEPTSQLGLLTIMQGPKWQNGQGGSLWVPPRQGGRGGSRSLKPLGARNQELIQ